MKRASACRARIGVRHEPCCACALCGRGSVYADGTDETRLVATGMDVLPELSGGNGALRGSGNCGCHQGPHGHERYAMWAGVDGFARTARWPAGEREDEVQPAPHTFNDPRPLGAFLGTSQAPRARSLDVARLGSPGRGRASYAKGRAITDPGALLANGLFGAVHSPGDWTLAPKRTGATGLGGQSALSAEAV